MRITIDGISFLIGNNDPISTDWVVYAILKGNTVEEELFRSMDDTVNIYSISPTLKRADGTEVAPEDISSLYAEIRMNFDVDKTTEFKRFDCSSLIGG